MMPEHFHTLVEKLKSKTLEGKAIWGKTSRTDEYKLSMNKVAVTTDRWKNNEGSDSVDLIIFNEDGVKIDSYVVDESQTDEFANMGELHALARRSFYKVEVTMKTIFNELDSDGIIGTGMDEGGDLPF